MEQSNAQQIAYWNGDGGARWAAAHEQLERQLTSISEALFAFAAPQPGEHAVDIGCGTGRTTIELHRRTGTPTVGIDISHPLLDIARARLTPELAVSFIAADAADHPFTARHQLVLSQFGVMFFAEPVAAFANLRTALVPGGRLVFACWRAIALNPWVSAPLAAALPLLPPQPPPDPHAPGPFALADDVRLRDLLARAGFAGVTIQPFDTTVWVGDTLDDAVTSALTIGPLGRIVAQLDPAIREPLREHIAAACAPFVTAAGVTPPAAAWLVRAMAPADSPPAAGP